MDIENEFGCTPCFCFGHSSQCSSAPKYQAHELSAHFIRDAEKWSAEDGDHKTAQLMFNANTQNIGELYFFLLMIDIITLIFLLIN